MPPRTDGLVAPEGIDQTSSTSVPDAVDAELLFSLNTILASVSLPRITHILDATPNLLIALYEALHQKRIPLVDRTPKSHTSFKSRVKNVKLLLGTIAHEANITVESAARLGEIDPLKVCQKDEDAVRELLWALVRIGILHSIQSNQRLPENVSPRKPLKPVGAQAKGTCLNSGQSGNAVSGLQKSLERRKELAGIQSVFPRASHGPVKAYKWLEDLPSSFSTLGHATENDHSKNTLHTKTQPEKQIHVQKAVLKVSDQVLVNKPMGRLQADSVQPSSSGPESPPHPSPKSSRTQIKPTAKRPTSRKSSQTLKPHSYPHAVYSVSFDEMPETSAEISPVSTVYLEHVSARIMKISNRLFPVTRITQPTENIIEPLSSKPAPLPPHEPPRTVSESSGTVKRLRKSSDMPLEKQGNVISHQQDTAAVFSVLETTPGSNSLARSVVSIPWENALNPTQDASTVELELPLDAPTSTSHSIERGTEVNKNDAGDNASARLIVEDITEQAEKYEVYKSEMEQGYENDILVELSNQEEYTSDEDQASTQRSEREQTVEDTREANVNPSASEDETSDPTEAVQMRRDPKLEDSKRSVDESEHQKRQGHDSAASPEASFAAPLTISNEVSFYANPDSSVPRDYKKASHAEEAPASADIGVGIYTSTKQLEPLLIDITQLDIPAPSVVPSVEENLIDLLSDPMPIGLSSVFCPIGPTKTWVATPRDLRSESRNGVINTPDSIISRNDSHLLSDGFDLSSLLQSSRPQGPENPTCAVPLTEFEASSVGSSSLSSILVHQGTQTEAPVAGATSHRINPDRSIPLPDSPNGIPESDMLKASTQREHRKVDHNSMGSSPIVDNVPASPARSDSAWMDFGNDVFTSTPKKKKPARRPSDPSLDDDEIDDNGEDKLASNAASNLRLLDLDTELDELSQEFSEYHITNHELPPEQRPEHSWLSVPSGKRSPHAQGSPPKPTVTSPRRPDTPSLVGTPNKPNPSSTSGLNQASSAWETDDDDSGEEEEEEGQEVEEDDAEQPTTEELHKQQIQTMQSILQNFYQAGNSQPHSDDNDSQYFPSESENVADDEDSPSHEAEYTYTVTASSGSQFSQGAGLEDVFAEPETPVPASKQPQPLKSTLLNLSLPPRFSGTWLFDEPQTPFTPVRPKRLFSTPIAKPQASRSLVLERPPAVEVQEDVGSKTLPTTFAPPKSLSPTPVLSKSLSLGRHIQGNASSKPRSASQFNRPASEPNNSIRASTPVNTNMANISLPSIQPPRTFQISKLNSRSSTTGTNTPVQGKPALPNIQPPMTTTSKLKPRGTPVGGTPSISMYYTPASTVKVGGVGARSGEGSGEGIGGCGEPRAGSRGRDGVDLMDMDLCYGLM